MIRPVLATALSLLCALGAGCRPKPEADEPVSAYSIAKRYGPITGKLAELVESGEADRIVRDDQAAKREYVLGRGRNEVRVTERWVLGEPYQIETITRRYYDPLADIPDDRIRLIVYGQNIGENALRITAPDDIRALVKAIRSDSYEEVWRMVMRDCRRIDGTLVQGGGGRIGAWGHGCSLGLYLDIGEAEPVCLSGHAPRGKFRRLGAKESSGFCNPTAHTVLKDIARKRGRDWLAD